MYPSQYLTSNFSFNCLNVDDSELLYRYWSPWMQNIIKSLRKSLFQIRTNRTITFGFWSFCWTNPKIVWTWKICWVKAKVLMLPLHKTTSIHKHWEQPRWCSDIDLSKKVVYCLKIIDSNVNFGNKMNRLNEAIKGLVKFFSSHSITLPPNGKTGQVGDGTNSALSSCTAARRAKKLNFVSKNRGKKLATK